MLWMAIKDVILQLGCSDLASVNFTVCTGKKQPTSCVAGLGNKPRQKGSSTSDSKLNNNKLFLSPEESSSP